MISRELKELHSKGFELHWLHPKSKRPVAMAWAKAPKLSWEEFKRAKPANANVGVRLGSVSQIGKHYLAVIDCDVKSGDVVHTSEMLSKLGGIVGAKILRHAPIVMSGRGNGSRHIYVLTEKPVRAQRLSQSPEKVKAYMPSAEKPSRYELEHLSEKEIKKGTRLRPAWEISLMGEGQQVVLPPSIHPDSGKPYEWGQSAHADIGIPVFTISQKEKTDAAETKQDFKAVDVDLVGSSLDSRIYDMIVDGTGVEDRSASLLTVSTAMLKAGFTDNEILSVLTNEDYFLGSVGYEHAQTKSRLRASQWVRKYSLNKAKRETLAQYQFDEEVEVKKLPREEAEKQARTLCPKKDWFDKIERTDPKQGERPKNTLKNMLLILTGAVGESLFVRDEFAHADYYGMNAPWGGKKGTEVADIDTVRIKKWCAENWRFEPSDDRINQAISAIADKNRFHPVREYLDGLTWDGKPRIDTWMRVYMGAKAREPYLSAISRKILVAMVKRIYEPGCKFDHVLILEGNQGVGKSTALSNLASEEWFTDADIDVTDKDSVMTMRSRWLVELGELSGMRSADVEHLKQFVSRRTDRLRVPYGKRAEDFPRQCVFIGTTNRDEYLKDPTGNRRFWPVLVGSCDFAAIARDRDQLFAEAKVAYELGEPIYLDDPGTILASVREQRARSITDSWEPMILDWLDKEGRDKEPLNMLDLFSDFGPLATWKPNMPEMKRAADCLRKLGLVRKPVKIEGHTVRAWVKP